MMIPAVSRKALTLLWILVVTLAIVFTPNAAFAIPNNQAFFPFGDSHSKNADKPTANPDSSDNEPRYASYLEKARQYQSLYGVGKIESFGSDGRQMKGLCVVDLIDFDQDGDEELLLVFYDESRVEYQSSDGFADASAYRAEVWDTENGSMRKLYESNLQWTNGGFAYLPIYHRSNDVAMHTIEYDTDDEGRSVGTDRIWVLDGTAFKEIASFSIHGMWGTGKIEYEIDGKAVDEDVYRTHFDDVVGSCTKTSYWMIWNDGSSHENEYWDTLNNPDETLEITKRAIKKLEGGNVSSSGAASTDDAWAQFPQRFVFSSGTGGWSTELNVAADGSFTGYFHDSDKGNATSSYPKGTRYETHFSGEFTSPVKVSDFEYSMQIKRLEITDPPGESIEDGMRIVHVTDSVYGLGGETIQPTGKFRLHLPGQNMTAFSDSAASWLHVRNTSGQSTNFFAIVNSSDPVNDLAFKTAESV